MQLRDPQTNKIYNKLNKDFDLKIILFLNLILNFNLKEKTRREQMQHVNQNYETMKSTTVETCTDMLNKRRHINRKLG